MENMYHYILAGFGWVLYIVGKLWVQRNQYDPNTDGLGWREVKLYLAMNWIAFLFNALLLIVFTPYVEYAWNVIMFSVLKWNWPFTDFAYVGAGGGVILLQMVMDFVQRRKQS